LVLEEDNHQQDSSAFKTFLGQTFDRVQVRNHHVQSQQRLRIGNAG
jgi:hypothetical protein